MKAVAVEKIEVGESRLQVIVRADPARTHTSAALGLAERARELLPGLSRHTCQNDEGRPFISELPDTETPHLLEHVACELMALAGSPRSLKAETTWDFTVDGKGVFRIALDYDDDLVAVGAVKYASEIVEWLFEGGDTPDISAIAKELGALRSV